jgi:hypothetical protein
VEETGGTVLPCKSQTWQINWHTNCKCISSLIIQWSQMKHVKITIFFHDKETGGPWENHRPVACHWQTLSHNVVHDSNMTSFFSYINKPATYYISIFESNIYIPDRINSIEYFVLQIRNIMDLFIIDYPKEQLYVHSLTL